MSWRLFVRPGFRSASLHAPAAPSRKLDRYAPNSDRIDARSRSRVAEVDERRPLRTQHALNFDFSRIRIIVDVDSRLDEKQLAVIVVEAKKAMGQDWHSWQAAC